MGGPPHSNTSTSAVRRLLQNRLHPYMKDNLFLAILSARAFHYIIDGNLPPCDRFPSIFYWYCHELEVKYCHYVGTETVMGNVNIRNSSSRGTTVTVYTEDLRDEKSDQ